MTVWHPGGLKPASASSAGQCLTWTTGASDQIQEPSSFLYEFSRIQGIEIWCEE